MISNDYRGIQASQHNRLTFHYFCDLMNVIHEVTCGKKFDIHVGDDEGLAQPGAEQYYEIVKLVKQRSGKGTINSIKKNTFPDIARMGFVTRFDRNDYVIDESQSRTGIYAVQLSRLGNEFVDASIFEQLKMFTDGVDKLTSNIGSELAELLYLNDFGIDYLELIEFMYIFSDDRLGITSNDKLRLLVDYRKLSPNQKQKLDENLKKYCDPRNRRKNADKTLLRDYSNWKNESQQIFGLLSNSAYFKALDNRLALNSGDLGVFNQEVIRRGGGKKGYFEEHNLKRDNDFELHHIIPFSKASNKADLLSIDDFKNLIYLHNRKHGEFSNKGNRHVRLKYDNNSPNILFLDFDESYIIVNLQTDTKVNPLLLPSMQEHNQYLLKKFYYYES